jgi:hypothetical protein
MAEEGLRETVSFKFLCHGIEAVLAISFIKRTAFITHALSAFGTAVGNRFVTGATAD